MLFAFYRMLGLRMRPEESWASCQTRRTTKARRAFNEMGRKEVHVGTTPAGDGALAVSCGVADHMVRHILGLGGFGLVSGAVRRQSADLSGSQLSVRPRESPFVYGPGEPQPAQAASIEAAEFDLGDVVGPTLGGEACSLCIRWHNTYRFPTCELRYRPRGEAV